jgi:hypothetical protein
MIPYATTTVSILRPSVPDGDSDGYPDEEAVYSPISKGTRAVIASPVRGARSGGRTSLEGSVQTVDVFKLVADPVEIKQTDRVLDEATLIVYRVEWLAPRTGLGLDHMSAGLSFYEGYAP